jgi:ABC-type glycerol-3-phosphate transport system substrate-binding protein
MKPRTALFVALASVALVAGIYEAIRRPGEEQANGGIVRLRFVSLAWQEQALRTNRAIVQEWNAAHPAIQVEYVQGTWNSVHDYLITAFETGDVPDVFHYESSVIVDFAMRGFLTDLGPMIDEEMRRDITEVAWASVRRPDGQISGIPLLMESLIGLYNRDLFEKRGIDPPTFEKPWTWTRLREVAKELTAAPAGDGSVDRWGVAVGLRNSANIIMNLSIAFGGAYFRKEGDRYVVRVGPEEKLLLSTIDSMLYVDRSASPSSVGLSGPALIPGFMQGKYAMVVGIGAWSRQQLAENAPAGFRWGVIPPLLAATQNTGTSAQTLSIPKRSRHHAEAMRFIKFMTDSTNMARLALSDWMLPPRASCMMMPEFRSPRNGWDVTTASAAFLSTGTWLGAPGYVEWKSRIANPVLQEYFSRRMTLEEAAARIEKESNVVLSRYQ